MTQGTAIQLFSIRARRFVLGVCTCDRGHLETLDPARAMVLLVGALLFFVLRGAAGQTGCPPGYGGRSCLMCGMGTYSPGGATSECLPCPPGTTTWTSGAVSARDCSVDIRGEPHAAYRTSGAQQNDWPQKMAPWTSRCTARPPGVITLVTNLTFPDGNCKDVPSDFKSTIVADLDKTFGGECSATELENVLCGDGIRIITATNFSDTTSAIRTRARINGFNFSLSASVVRATGRRVGGCVITSWTSPCTKIPEPPGAPGQRSPSHSDDWGLQSSGSTDGYDWQQQWKEWAEFATAYGRIENGWDEPQGHSRSQCHADPPGIIRLTADLVFPDGDCRAITPDFGPDVLSDLQRVFGGPCVTAQLLKVSCGMKISFQLTFKDTGEAHRARTRLFSLANNVEKAFSPDVTQVTGLRVSGCITTAWTSPCGTIKPHQAPVEEPVPEAAAPVTVRGRQMLAHHEVTNSGQVLAQPRGTHSPQVLARPQGTNGQLVLAQPQGNQGQQVLQQRLEDWGNYIADVIEEQAHRESELARRLAESIAGYQLGQTNLTCKEEQLTSLKEKLMYEKRTLLRQKRLLARMKKKLEQQQKDLAREKEEMAQFKNLWEQPEEDWESSPYSGSWEGPPYGQDYCPHGQQLPAWANCGGLNSECQADKPCDHLCCPRGFFCYRKDPGYYQCRPYDFPQAEPTCSGKQLGPWQQCGGLYSDCKADKRCDHLCCPQGHHCYRKDQWYHECRPHSF